MIAQDQILTVSEPAPADSDELRGLERRRLVDALIPLRDQGKSYAQCAELLGVSAPTLHRLEKAWRAEGEAGLATKHHNAGRPRLADRVFTPRDIAFVKRLTLQSESLPLALERLSDVGTCSPEARALIDRYRQTGNYPPSFYKLFHITEEEWAMAKGTRTFDGVTHTARRGMEIVEADGTRRQLVSGDLIEADDVSIDCPYYVRLPDGSFSVGRQVLVFRDRRSRKWVGAYAVARDRDSYRGEDIARACRELVDAWGLPGRFRFERGTWESEPISGIKVEGLTPDSEGRPARWGGIANLIPIQHVYTSRAKGTIEGGFRMLHKVLGLHGVRIGKSRGEYEAPTADMLAVNAGRKDPAACGFIAWADLLRVFNQVFTLLNQRPVFFQELGRKVAPDDAWTQDMADRPGGRLPACAPKLLWHFLPVKREVGASIAQAGHVKVSVAGYPLPFFFRIGGDDADGQPLPFIERGHRLIVAFDPQRAAEGAVIFNAETGPRNTQGWRLCEQLFTAPLAGEAPQIDLSGRAGGSDDIRAKKVRNSQVRAGFTSIGLYGQGARTTNQDHDGAGNVARIEKGAPARSRAAAPAPAQAPREAVAQALHARRAASAPIIEEDFSSEPVRTNARHLPPDPVPVIEEDLDLR